VIRVIIPIEILFEIQQWSWQLHRVNLPSEILNQATLARHKDEHDRCFSPFGIPGRNAALKTKDFL